MSHPPQHLREGRLLQATKQFVPRHLTAAQSGRRDAAEQTCQQPGVGTEQRNGVRSFPFRSEKGTLPFYGFFGRHLFVSFPRASRGNQIAARLRYDVRQMCQLRLVSEISTRPQHPHWKRDFGSSGFPPNDGFTLVSTRLNRKPGNEPC